MQQVKEKFEDTKRVIRICKSKEDRQHNGQKSKQTKEKHKTLHSKQKIEQNDPH